jgi:hypothetical protein
LSTENNKKYSAQRLFYNFKNLTLCFFELLVLLNFFR